MKKRTYIQTDDNTANLVELLLAEIKDLRHWLCTLSNHEERVCLFTEKKTAEILDISIRGLINLRKEGKIHYRQLGKNIRYTLDDISEFEDNCKR
jgi:hypothetical protein